MIEEKGLGNKRVNAIKLSLTNRENGNLSKLATALNKRPAELAREILFLCLEDSLFVDQLQKNYCTQSAYKVRMVNKGGNIYFVLTGREDLD